MSTTKKLAKKAEQQKAQVLKSGGFTPVPHTLYRDVLPQMAARCKNKMDARDALALYMYLLAYVNGENDSSLYMWAYPNVKQISDTTGIHRDRIAKLCKLLEDSGLLITKHIRQGKTGKKIYLPCYETCYKQGNGIVDMDDLL